ncbi:MAG TPA: DUF981 family protein [Candidatus Paceibacterota bacterium]|nr:DUF981 family protein [Candidatus Paceibacterota bacterium]
MSVLVMYNTIMAVAVGAGLIGVALLGRQLENRQAVASEGWSLLFGILGLILSILGFVMTITWPFRVPGTFTGNVLMGEPSVAFGLLLLAASFYLWQRRSVFAAVGSSSEAESSDALSVINRTLKPVSIFVFGVGLMMLACAVAWIRYRLGNAPSVEPLTGYLATVVLKNAPIAESYFLGILWGLVALGALLFPVLLSKRGASVISKIIFIAWMVAGCAFLGFGALNFYTHVGLISNTTNGTDFKL